MKPIIISLILLFSTVGAVPSKSDFSKAFIQVAEKGNPAVVSIVSEKTVNFNHQQFFSPFGFKFPDEEFTNKSLGSGVILDAKKGYIVTNNHVIEEADEIKVVLLDKTELEATIIGTDPLSDLAIIQVESKALSQIKLGKSNALKVGEWVVAIGSPFGLHLNHTVTAGIVSAVGRSDVISRLNFENFIQHDAAINPGNSGGALLNLDGELIGINTAIATDGYSRGNTGVGFAIPIDQVKRVTDDLINDGKVTRGWLGVSIQDIDDNMAKALKLDDKQGAIISEVFEDSPAEKSGLLPHDIIITVDGKSVSNSSSLKNMVSSGRPNDKVKLIIMREGKTKKITLTLGTRPNQDDLLAGNFRGKSNYDVLGFIVKENENGDIEIIDVDKKSNARKQNIRAGDIIKAIGSNEISTQRKYKHTIKTYKTGDVVMLRILRNGNARYIAYEIS